jgi:hypothetical protein
MAVVDDQDLGRDGDEELPAPAYYESEGEGQGEPQTPVPGLHSREATPTPYSRGEEREQGREGE